MSGAKGGSANRQWGVGAGMSGLRWNRALDLERARREWLERWVRLHGSEDERMGEWKGEWMDGDRRTAPEGVELARSPPPFRQLHLAFADELTRSSTMNDYQSSQVDSVSLVSDQLVSQKYESGAW